MIYPNKKSVLFPIVNTCLILILLFVAIGCDHEGTPRQKLRNEIEKLFDETPGEFAMAYHRIGPDGDSLLINASEEFHAASTMKTPVMIELFKQSRQGTFGLRDTIQIINTFKSIVDDSVYSLDVSDDSEDGLYGRIGENSTIYDLMYDMITVSSNLATNILIELVDAKKVTNSMREFGAMDIQVLRGVEDQKAFDQGLSNSTTAMDLLVIMLKIATHEAGTPEDCQEMMRILEAQKFNEIIPHFLPKEVKVAHKTGVITALHHDSGIVTLPDGTRYVLVLLSKNLGDFDEGTLMLAKVSKLVYNYVVGDK